jgi:hypothetical protein
MEGIKIKFYELFVCICVLYFCHRVTTQLQLTNIYHVFVLMKKKSTRFITAFTCKTEQEFEDSVKMDRRRADYDGQR